MDIPTCFFHELGHFVALTLNKTLFEEWGVDELKIYPCAQNKSKYCGHVKPTRPDGVPESDKTPVPLERLPQYLVMKMYGCIFQTYYQKSNQANLHNTCFDRCFGHLGNGQQDVNDWLNALRHHGLGSLNIKISDAINNHINKLKNERALDTFMKVSPDNYLTFEGENYIGNIEMLEADLKNDIQKFLPIYQDLTIEIKTILDNKKQENTI